MIIDVLLQMHILPKKKQNLVLDENGIEWDSKTSKRW
jgi:hypothetical protein